MCPFSKIAKSAISIHLSVDPGNFTKNVFFSIIIYVPGLFLLLDLQSDCEIPLLTP